jgi:hypothetical protein
LSLRNAGTTYLNECKIKGAGKYASWISAEGVKELNIGQIVEILFTINVPKDTKTGEYEMGLNIECLELKDGVTFQAEIIQKKLVVSLNDAKREENKLKVSYSLSELAGEEQDVDVELVLLGTNNERVSELREKKKISSNSNNKYEAVMGLPADAKGNLNLIINAKSKIASAFVQEYVLLEGGALGGFAVFDAEHANSYVSAAVVIAFLVFAFVVGRRILKYRGIEGRKSIISAIVYGMGYHKHRWGNAKHYHDNAPVAPVES